MEGGDRKNIDVGSLGLGVHFEIIKTMGERILK
jgi:hypothetical protein